MNTERTNTVIIGGRPGWTCDQLLPTSGRTGACRPGAGARCGEPVPPRCFVFLYAATGDQHRALEWLERAYESRDSGLFWLRVMPLYDPLRTTPRFKEILRRIGLPPN